jgi:hypothetical protein
MGGGYNNDTTHELLLSSTAYPYSGLMDDVRVYNRVLSADEIKRLYQLGATTKIGQTITSNATPEDGLLVHYTFDGTDVDWSSTTAEIRDRSGNNYYGNATTTMSASKSPTEGVLGQGMEFDGVQDGVYGGIGVLPETQQLTVAFWLYADEWPEDFDSVVSVSELGQDWSYFQIVPDETDGDSGLCLDNRMVFIARSQTGDNFNCYVQPRTGQWNHYVGVMDISQPGAGELVGLYLNGVLLSPTDSGTPVNNTSNFFYAGEHQLELMNTSLYSDSARQGMLDDVRIYNRALSADEVKRLYELGN